jgi:crotonobetainyl-CoA:carnitine CoA-transferase CaiB-like acyl-CoA transferase
MLRTWTDGLDQERVLTTYLYRRSLFYYALSTNYQQVNRNKKSVGVSFKEEKGADLIRKLALDADVFVENYLPGTLKKYGLDFKTLNKANPKLIYASVTGYGQFGPYSNRAGYDVMVEAWADPISWTRIVH